MKVVNPFAEHLTFLDDKTRTRRDHRKYLGLIRAVALLHQHQRPIRTLDRPGRDPVPYIEATLDDIAAANRLAHAVLGTTLDELPPQTRTLLRLVREHIAARAAAEGVHPRDLRFTRREVREATCWGDTQLKLHLHRLEELEYLLVRREGTRFVYELAWAGEGETGTPFVMGLIEVDRLRHQYDRERSGVEAEQSPLGRGTVGPVSPPGRSAETAQTPGMVRLAASIAAPLPESTSAVAVGERRSYVHAAR
ncbi:DNA primase [Sphingobium indicum BiD32]|uniref:DNA primase n=2 Tax=Sphingobium indicum TaxID=332055 RepID=N1MQ41_9SPHN|nr:DNA primase [Sphingobium indicum BiD32]